MILVLVAWAAATVLHFALTVRAAGRLLPPSVASLDERLFAAVLGGVASLSIVLHGVAVTTGLGLGSGIGGLAAWHAGLWWATRARAPKEVPPAALAVQATPIETLAIAVFAGIVLTWVGLAAQSADILGPDAAHYHVPYAVNLAAGASPFDLPATPHLYPMAGSMVAAWFIVPLGNPLIVDLAMALPFVLLAASVNLLFRSATGLSGTAWASWLVLVLFSTPMFRSASLGSADLWFAAAFVSFLAVIILVWSRARLSAFDVVLGGCALGLLVGSKTTGAPAAVLLIGAALLLAGLRRMSGGAPVAWPRRPALVVLAGFLACVGAGGVWLVRNWVQFGSPIAPSGLVIGGLTVFVGQPFQPTTYLSVLGELETDAFHLWPRTRFFVGQWFGSWFLIGLWPIAGLVVDLVARARQRRTDGRWWPRFALLVMTAGVGAGLVWLLIGAPWTGLERSRGLTLRYALPVAALLPLLSLVACFPLSLPWHQRAGLRTLTAAVVVFGSGAIFRASAGAPAQSALALPVPGLGLTWFAVGLVLAVLMRVAGRWPVRLPRGVALLVSIGALAWWAPAIARQDVAARARAETAFEAEETRFGAGATPADAWREVFLAVRAAEHGEGVHCRAERFFSLVRFDEPLALQPPGFGNQVYYAGRDVEAARRAGPIASCDYVITTPELAEIEKGQALAAALAGEPGLRPFARTKDVIVLTPAGR